jgi:ArsR family transcriptional regulator
MSSFMNNTFPVQFYKNLADDTRLKVLLLLQRETELCVCELTMALALSQPKVSRHIAQLKVHHLLSERKVGRWVFYRLADELPLWQKEVLELSLSNNPDLIKNCLEALHKIGTYPRRRQEFCDSAS